MKYKKVTKNDWDDRQVASLWPRKDKQGASYLSGDLDLNKFGINKKINIAIVKNKHRNKDTHPSHYIRVGNNSLHELKIPLVSEEDEFMKGDVPNKDYSFVEDMEEQDKNGIPDFDLF